MRRLGLLGGTFDPPHIGHLLLAETARISLDLDHILFLPVGDPPHKNDRGINAAAHRIAMTRLAIAGNPYFAVDTSDVDRPPPHFTYTLLPLIQAQYPQAALWFLLGTDSLADLPQWQCPEQLLQLCRLAVLERPGVILDWVHLQQRFPGLAAQVDWLDGPLVKVSATMVRGFAAANRSLRYLIPETVQEYITRHTLYQSQRQLTENEGPRAE